MTAAFQPAPFSGPPWAKLLTHGPEGTLPQAVAVLYNSVNQELQLLPAGVGQDTVFLLAKYSCRALCMEMKPLKAALSQDACFPL